MSIHESYDLSAKIKTVLQETLGSGRDINVVEDKDASKKTTSLKLSRNHNNLIPLEIQKRDRKTWFC